MGPGDSLTRALLVGWAAVTAVLACADAVLLRRNAALEAQISPQLPLRADSSVSALRGLGLGGNDVSVGYGRAARETLVLVVSPSCHFCEINWPNWRRLLQAPRSNLRVVLVGNNPDASLPAAYVTEHVGAEVTVVATPDPGSFADYHLFYAPQTILVSASGRVIGSWLGVLDEPTLYRLTSRLLPHPG